MRHDCSGVVRGRGRGVVRVRRTVRGHTFFGSRIKIKGNLTSIGTARHSWHGSPQTKMKKNEILYGCLHEFKFYRERASCGLPGTVRGDEARARGGEVEPEI